MIPSRRRARPAAIWWCLALCVAGGLTIAPTAAADIYWGHFAYQHGVGRAGLDGSGVNPAFAPSGVAPYAFDRGVAADGSHVYWGSHSGAGTVVIGRAAADGTGVNQAFTGASGQNITGMAVSPTYLYWTSQSQDTGGIGRTPVVGGQQFQSLDSVFGEPNPMPCGVAVDDTYVYWANRGTWSISRAPLATFGDPDKIEPEFIRLPINVSPCGVAVDDTHIYWGVYSTVNSGVLTGGRTIGRALKATGGDVENAFLGGGNWVTGVAVQGDFIYWTNFANYAAGGGSIGRASIAGNGVDAGFVAGLDAPWGIALDTRGAPAAPPTPPPIGPVPVSPPPLSVYDPGGGSDVPPPTPVRPDFSRVWTTRVVFAPARWSTSVFATTAAATAEGTVFNFVLAGSATVKIAIQREAKGRKLGGRCQPPTKRLRRKAGCRRFVAVATLTRVSHQGLNRVPFSGRIRGKALTPGRYRAVFTATAGAVTARTKTIAFRIVKP